MGQKSAMNADWVQPHMQEESKILNLEINHCCLGFYMRRLFIFNKATNGNLIPRVSKVKKHVYRYSSEWPKAVPVCESDSCVSHWSEEVHLQNAPWSSPREALALLSQKYPNTKLQHIFLPASTSIHRNWFSKAVNRSEGATTFVTLLLRFSKLHVGSWHILILTWEVERRKNLSNPHPIPKARKQLWAVSFAFHQSSFLGSWWFRNLSCAVFNSGKMFDIFIQCLSSAWHVWSLHCCSRSPRAALPAALVCSTAFTILCQETNFFHYCPTCHPIGLISSIPRYSQFYTCLFAIHRPDSYYSSTWAQVHFRHSLWDCLRSATPNVLNACTAAAFWIPSHEQGALCARCCTRMIHTYQSVEHGKQFY